MTDDLVKRLREFVDKIHLLGEEADRIKELEKARIKDLNETMWEFDLYIYKLEMSAGQEKKNDG